MIQLHNKQLDSFKFEPYEWSITDFYIIKFRPISVYLEAMLTNVTWFNWLLLAQESYLCMVWRLHNELYKNHAWYSIWLARASLLDNGKINEALHLICSTTTSCSGSTLTPHEFVLIQCGTLASPLRMFQQLTKVYHPHLTLYRLL